MHDLATELACDPAHPARSEAPDAPDREAVPVLARGLTALRRRDERHVGVSPQREREVERGPRSAVFPILEMARKTARGDQHAHAAACGWGRTCLFAFAERCIERVERGVLFGGDARLRIEEAARGVRDRPRAA